MDQATQDYYKGVVESLLFVNDKPVSGDQLKQAIESLNLNEIKKLIVELKEEYETHQRGLAIVEVAGGYQMLSNPGYASFIRNFFKMRVKDRLTHPALEALAIIAYKQPVSRMDIELIRGVNSDGVVGHLLERGLIKVTGRKEVPGRPYLYGTTKLFLEYFGLRALEDMPKLDVFTEMKKIDEHLKLNEEKLLAANEPPAQPAQKDSQDSGEQAEQEERVVQEDLGVPDLKAVMDELDHQEQQQAVSARAASRLQKLVEEQEPSSSLPEADVFTEPSKDSDEATDKEEHDTEESS